MSQSHCSPVVAISDRQSNRLQNRFDLIQIICYMKFMFVNICKIGLLVLVVQPIKTTRPTGGLLQGYKPMLPASASRRWLSLCSSLLPLPLSPPLKGCLYYSPPLKGSSYSRTLNLSSAISCFSWSSMYFLMVASFRPTVLT